MEHNQLNTNSLPAFELGNCADPKAATAKVVKYLESESLLSPSTDNEFYSAFEKYQNGESEITDFPFLAYLLKKGEEKKPILASTVKVFIDAGADVNAKDDAEWTPLHIASSKGYVDIVNILLAADADVDAKDDAEWTPLHIASARGYVDIVNILLAADADVDARTEEEGKTPLHYAKTAKVVKALLAADADPEARDYDTITPLHEASYWRKTEVIKALLKARVDVNILDTDSLTPLHMALSNSCVEGLVETVTLLLDFGADVNARDAGDKTPLLYLLRFMYECNCCGHPSSEKLPSDLVKVVKILLEEGADVNAEDCRGYTALHYAKEVEKSLGAGTGEVQSDIGEILKAAGAQ